MRLRGMLKVLKGVRMADTHITLSTDMLQLVDLQIASGRFTTPAEVVGAALLALKREEDQTIKS